VANDDCASFARSRADMRADAEMRIMMLVLLVITHLIGVKMKMMVVVLFKRMMKLFIKVMAVLLLKMIITTNKLSPTC
jgi:hypothetical protein